jgi:hypothetical protein
VAANCAGGLEAAAVEKLLRRHGIIDKKRRGGLDPREVAQLTELFAR